METRKDNRPNRLWVLTPTMGICLFGLLYVLAACQYPGGSNDDRTAVGFSWQHNYWCDLLGDAGKNGMHNPARPIALTAMLVLGSSLSVFWGFLPLLHPKRNRFLRISQGAGMLSMFIILFIGTSYHDLVMNVAGGLGLLALITTFVGLYRNQFFKLYGYGLFCALLIGLNNYVYYSQNYLHYLPVIQKITFVLVLLWFILVNRATYRRAQEHMIPPNHS